MEPSPDRVSATDETAGFSQFLLAELQYLQSAFLANESDGEKRVTFFIALTGGALTALGFLRGEDGVGSAFPPTLVTALVLLSLIVLGRLTLLRIIRRNQVSDEYKEKMAQIRTYFITGKEDPRLRYLPFSPFAQREVRRYRFPGMGRGGWFETIVVLNALVTGLLALVVTQEVLVRIDHPGVRELGWALSALAGLAVMLAAWWAQVPTAGGASAERATP